MRLTVRRASRLVGEFRPPSDKSLTHRAYMLAAIAKTPSYVATPLEGEDCESTLACLQSMGLGVRRGESGIRLTPPKSLQTPRRDLDCGNSGTTARLLAGIVASRSITARFVGDASLSRRPMRRIAEPLRQMGAELEGDTLPMIVRGGRLRGISYDSPVASAQIKSAILLAGLNAEGQTTVREPSLSRNHTEKLLRALGVPLVHDPEGVTLPGPASFDGFEFKAPGDPSSAAFFLIAALMLPGSEVVATETLMNGTRTGFLRTLETMGGQPMLTPTETRNLGEPFGTVSLRAADELRAFEIGGDRVPSLIDEIPILAVLATQCRGTTVFRDCAELRVKESDRLAKMAQGLRAMGASIEETRDGLIIEGPTPLTGTTIDADGDHRIAMSFAIAGLVADGETIIEGAESIATSFPNFESELQRLCQP